MEIVKTVLVAGLSFMIILSGIFKITKNKKITEKLTAMGVGPYLPALGVAEIIFSILFIYPPTRNAGFILLACYFSGAFATDLSHKNPVTAPVIFLTLLFVTAYMNNPALFF